MATQGRYLIFRTTADGGWFGVDGAVEEYWDGTRWTDDRLDAALYGVTQAYVVLETTRVPHKPASQLKYLTLDLDALLAGSTAITAAPSISVDDKDVALLRDLHRREVSALPEVARNWKPGVADQEAHIARLGAMIERSS